jgi:type I restriction enzyme R subunit
MLFYAAQVARERAMLNPTVVVLTDRNDLDEQLYGQFQRCHELLGQLPQQATSVQDLRTRLSVASGGIVFTTIHKFAPDERRAHAYALRPQKHCRDRRRSAPFAVRCDRRFPRRLRDALPNAAFIGFTGTPIETFDANTRAIFGEYISVYDIQRAVADKATVPIYYEAAWRSCVSTNRLRRPSMTDFEELTEAEEVDHKEQLKTKWAALEAMVGDPDTHCGDRRRYYHALPAAHRSDGRKGDDCLYESAYLR